MLRIAIMLVFGLAMVGPEAHACPVHDQMPAHHQHTSGHHQRAHCTCPQACCPAGVGVSLPSRVPAWTIAPLPAVALDLEFEHAHTPPARPRFLPFGLAPPLL